MSDVKRSPPNRDAFADILEAQQWLETTLKRAQSGIDSRNGEERRGAVL